MRKYYWVFYVMETQIYDLAVTGVYLKRRQVKVSRQSQKKILGYDSTTSQRLHICH